MKKSYLFIAIAAFAFACGQPKEKTETVEEEVAVEKVVEEEVAVEYKMAEEGDSTHFGRLINAEEAVTVADFVDLMNGKDSMEIKISAIAQDVCQKKGCWMKVDLADGESMRIKFKDYGFFVPMDITGKEVVFSGKAFTETTSVEDLRHYAEDGGESAEAIAAITEAETSISFLADGVLIK
jgi:hypothetical protein